MNNCIPFLGAKHRQGYGMVNRKDSKEKYAHRYTYEKAHGEIPAGLVVMHSCDNPSCVNLEHLSLGTQQDNIKDRDKKGRTAVGSANARTKMTPSMITYAKESVLSSRKVAEELGVSHTAVLDARKGKTYLSRELTLSSKRIILNQREQ